ncbi:MAG: hypothetical protein AAFS11_06795 [Planctomycetota bacterium]
MSDADQLRAYLADRDVPCPGCKYNLRDLVHVSCPECDAAIDLAALTSGPVGTRMSSFWILGPLLWCVVFVFWGTSYASLAANAPPPQTVPLIIDAVALTFAGLGPGALIIWAQGRRWAPDHFWHARLGVLIAGFFLPLLVFALWAIGRVG